TNFCTSAANRHRALGADFVVIHGLVKIMRQSLHELIDRAALCDIDAVRNHQDIDQGFNYLETVLSKAWFDSREDEKVVELEQTVQDLVGERALYEAIYVHASEPIFVLDPSGTIQSLNPAAAKLLTVTRAEAIGRPVSDVVPWLASAVDQPPNGDRFVEVEVATPNGVRCYQIKQALLPAILAGRAAQLVISLTDITPLRQQAAQMKKTAEELTFLNDFALELADAAIETGICWLVAKRLRALTGAAFCAVSHLRVRDNRWGVYAVDGAPDDLRRIEQVLGRSPLGMTYQISRFALDQLSAYPLLPIRSLEEMSQGFLTSEDAKGIRAALDVGDCYGLAFLYRGQPVGTAVFVMPKQRPLDKSKISVLQPFSHLAAIALQRAISER
ncbi:MAG: PAS domain-containing protein, partial [Bacillota bacterium]